MKNKKDGQVKHHKTISRGTDWAIGSILFFYLLTNMIILFKAFQEKECFPYQPIMESTFLSTGLSIIGIAISVWAGLNIMNALDRKEVEKVRKDIDDANEELEKLDKVVSKFSGDMAYLGDSIKRTFMLELLKTNRLQSSIYFYRRFSEKQGMMDNAIYAELLSMEQLFGQVYLLHDTLNTDEIAVQKAEEGKVIAEKLIGEYTADTVVGCYVRFRMADFNFYTGYKAESKVSMYKYFSDAVEQYLGLLRFLEVDIPAYQKGKRIPVFYANASKRELHVFMANTIGEAYSKILEQVAKKHDFESYVEEPNEYIGEKALYYCGIAASWAEGSMKKEVYFRNYGCALERMDIYEGAFGNRQKQILENYKKAFYLAIDDSTVPVERVQKIYSTLLSYYCKYYDNWLRNNVLKYASENKDVLTAQNLMEIIYKENVKNFSAQDVVNLADYYEISEFARCDLRRNHMQYAMHGRACVFIVIGLRMKNRDVEKIFKESESFYLKKAEEMRDLLGHMNVNDDYTKWLNIALNEIKIFDNASKGEKS